MKTLFTTLIAQKFKQRGSRLLNILAAGLIAAAYSLGAAQPALAMSGDQRDIYKLGINLYDDEIKTGTYATSCGDSGGNIVLKGGDNVEKGWNFFKDKGLSDITTAAIVGNLGHESAGLNPTIMQIGGNSKDPRDAGSLGYGIAQWTPGRTILDAAKANRINGPIYELSTQLNLVWAQLKGTAPTSRHNVLAGLKKITKLSDAVAYFQQNFESGANFGPRYTYAQQVLKKFGGTGGGGGGGSLDPCAASNGSTNAIVKYALTYAWHKVYSPPHLAMTKEYKAAIQKAIAKNDFVGGGIHPGIDCGGFVTRVMHDSGADPNYNPQKSNTDAQWAYLRSHTKKYKHLGDKDKLQPGDIGINGTHTFIYVGKQDGFPGNIAQASYGGSNGIWFAPQAGTMAGGIGGSSFEFYRLR